MQKRRWLAIMFALCLAHSTVSSKYTDFPPLIHLSFVIKSKRGKLLRNNILPEQLGISVVARSLYPDLDYKTIWDEPIPSAMERESQLAKNYCADFLRGDFTKWTDVLNARKNRRK
jgi:hypothetical protein